MNNYYVYIHRKKDNDAIFYIGISCQDKYRRAKTSIGRNNLWCKIVKKHGYYSNILVSNISKENAIKIEVFLIKVFGRIDNNTGCLANLTDGGDGSYNCPKSTETKQKMKLSKLGKKHTEETKQKMSIARIGKIKSEASKEKTKKSMLGKNKKKVVDENTGVIYNSVSEAALFLNIPHPTLSRYLTGVLKNKTSMKFI